jgi:hypothetical protein
MTYCRVLLDSIFGTWSKEKVQIKEPADRNVGYDATWLHFEN